MSANQGFRHQSTSNRQRNYNITINQNPYKSMNSQNSSQISNKYNEPTQKNPPLVVSNPTANDFSSMNPYLQQNMPRNQSNDSTYQFQHRPMKLKLFNSSQSKNHNNHNINNNNNIMISSSNEQIIDDTTNINDKFNMNEVNESLANISNSDTRNNQNNHLMPSEIDLVEEYSVVKETEITSVDKNKTKRISTSIVHSKYSSEMKQHQQLLKSSSQLCVDMSQSQNNATNQQKKTFLNVDLNGSIKTNDSKIMTTKNSNKQDNTFAHKINEFASQTFYRVIVHNIPKYCTEVNVKTVLSDFMPLIDSLELLNEDGSFVGKCVIFLKTADAQAALVRCSNQFKIDGQLLEFCMNDRNQNNFGQNRHQQHNNNNNNQQQQQQYGSQSFNDHRYANNTGNFNNHGRSRSFNNNNNNHNNNFHQRNHRSSMNRNSFSSFNNNNSSVSYDNQSNQYNNRNRQNRNYHDRNQSRHHQNSSNCNSQDVLLFRNNNNNFNGSVNDSRQNSSIDKIDVFHRGITSNDDENLQNITNNNNVSDDQTRFTNFRN